MSPSIDISNSSGSFDAYVAKPSTPSAPAVVVLQEIFGVNADLRQTCDDLAKQGFLAVSPDLFWRLQRNVDMTDATAEEWKKGLDLYAAFDFECGVADVFATMERARSLPGCNGKVGLMGYCLGGLMAFMTAERHVVDATVVYYGGRMEEHLEQADRIRGPLMVHVGEEDEYISKNAQQAIVAALAGNPLAQVFRYPGSRHAFARHGGCHFDREAATLANNRTSAFLKAQLL